MYRINQNRGISSRQRLDLEAQERMLNRRNTNCSSCNLHNHHSESHCQNEDYANNSFNYALAMVYSPKQEWQNIYCEEEGFIAGTIFKELDKPFYGAKCHGGTCNE